MGKYRGLNITGGLNANFRKIKVRKTLDTMELLDRGSIAEAKSDLPTKGAAHRRGRGALKSQRKGANSATRGSISMGWIAGDDSNVIGEHDYGYVFRNAESANSAVWDTRRALGVAASIADEQNAVATEPVHATGVYLYNSTGIIPAGTPLILNGDGTVSAVTGGSYQGAGLSTTYDNPNSSGDLGRSASISDTYVAATDANSGTVSIFNRETGTHIRTHTKSADSSERWGWFLDNSDDYVVVGDASPDYSRQVLDVWRISDGASMTTIYHPTNGNNMFPGSLAIHGNYILAGAYQGVDENNINTGAYLWNAQNGSLLRSYSRDIADLFHFGRAVTMNSTYAFVWSPRWYPQSLGYDEVPAKVHVFTFTSNNAVARHAISWFGGYSQAELDCDENHVIIGGGGKAGIIDITTGNLVRELVPPDGEAGTAFGSDVSIDGNYAAVSGSGKVFVYDVTTGDVLATLQDPDGNALTFYTQVIRARSNGDILVANRSAADGGKLYKYTIGEIQTTNLTSDNYIGFAGSEFSYDGALGQVITGGGVVTGLSGLIVDADYYVQNDGSISTTVTDVFAGTATSPTTLALPAPTIWAGALGQVAGGWDSAARSSVDSINIATGTSATSHASLTSQAAFGDHALSTGSYAVMPAGGTSMHKWSIPTGGDSSSFGDSLTSNDAQRGSAAGNGVRGVWRGNNSNRYDKFEWMALDTGGNTQHFADLPTKFGTDDAMAGNDTKGLSGMGSHQDDYGGSQRCYYVIYDTTGSAYNFGNLGRDATRPAAAGDDTHGLWAGGGHANYNSVYSGITAVTYDTGGTAINGGSLSRARKGGCAMSDKTYFIHMGGYANGNVHTGARNDIDKRVIATGGNATLIGNLSTKRVFSSGTSGNSA